MTGARPDRSPRATGRRLRQTAAARGEERRALHRARDSGAPHLGRGARAPRYSTPAGLRPPAAGGRLAPAGRGQLRARARAAAPTEAEAAALRAQVSAAAARGPEAQAPAPAAPARAKVWADVRQRQAQARNRATESPSSIDRRQTRGRDGPCEGWRPSRPGVLLALRLVEDFGDLVGGAVCPLRGRQQPDVLRHLDLRSFVCGNFAVVAAKPAALARRLERLERRTIGLCSRGLRLR